MNDRIPAKPDALLLVANGCPHCPTVREGLSELARAEKIGKLEVVNINERPEVAESLGVRSVPWIQLGPFELEGLHSPAELRHWAEKASSPHGIADYYSELFKTGQLAKVIAHIRKEDSRLSTLVDLLSDPDTELQVRIGIGAVMEEFEGTRLLKSMTGRLGKLTLAVDNTIRSDACHYLGLTHSARAIPYLETCLDDPDAEVREIASESLESLGQGQPDVH